MSRGEDTRRIASNAIAADPGAVGELISLGAKVALATELEPELLALLEKHQIGEATLDLAAKINSPHRPTAILAHESSPPPRRGCIDGRGEQTRRIASDDTIPVGILRDFLLRALRHEAIADVLIERMASRAERGNLDPFTLSAILPDLIAEIVVVATNEDWTAIADVLIEDMREALLEEAES